jgi:hypothetical protein
MNVFLVLVVLAIPARPGFSDVQQVVHRELITSSGPVACQQHANKRAEEQSEKRAADLQRFKARIYGICIQQKDPV